MVVNRTHRFMLFPPSLTEVNTWFKTTSSLCLAAPPGSLMIIDLTNRSRGFPGAGATAQKAEENSFD
jgi:hypothetical protein